MAFLTTIAWMLVTFGAGFGLATAMISRALADILAVSLHGDTLHIRINRDDDVLCESAGDEESVHAVLEEEKKTI